MNLKISTLALSLFVYTTLLLADNSENGSIMLPPANPICTQKTCPYVFKKENNLISINCMEAQDSAASYDCMLTASNGRSSAVQNLSDDLDANLNYIWLTPNLLEIIDHYQQGAAAYYDKRYIFVDFTTMQISSIFFNIYASNLNKMVVVTESATSEDQTPIPTIYIIPMFNSNQSISITRNFAGFFTHRIYPQPLTHFLNNGNLVLVYRTSQHKNVTEVIPVDYTKLGIITQS